MNKFKSVGEEQPIFKHEFHKQAITTEFENKLLEFGLERWVPWVGNRKKASQRGK